MGVEEFQDGLSGGAELSEVILMEFRVGFHRFKVKFIEGLYIVEGLCSEGKPETIGEVHNGVIGGRSLVISRVQGLLLLLRASSRLQTWLIGVMQIIHPR